MQAGSIGTLLREAAETDGDAPALVGVDGTAINYHELLTTVHAVAGAIAAAGLAPDRSVAVVLANGPTLASAFLGASIGSVCAPLNPTYTAAELAFFFDDLDVAALISDGCSPAAIALAEERGIPVLRPPFGAVAYESCRSGDDVALVLHTSGTTARPKQVPLTHANLCASAANVAATLQLSSADTCLNVMPLFHIHGIVAALLASLTARGTVVCTPGFDGARFLEWIAEHRASWYTAVPTIHQAALAASRRAPNSISTGTLRLIRSSSAALPPAVKTDLEQQFNVPVIEAYGMTEASHQIASNPLPPAVRRSGSVGRAAGADVAIMSPKGELLPSGSTGEIVIRGSGVTAGYVGDDAVNVVAFANGWFHTGDEGSLDGDGYLTISGRLKEMINRGGEKISPREIDEVLLEHPAVSRAVAFAVPHPTLGEDVAAAVVAVDGDLDIDDLRRHVAARVAAHKVPGKIVVLDELPVGATGKVQRVGMAARLGLDRDATRTVTVEATPLEAALVEMWAQLLGVEQLDVHERFLDLGGDSLSAIELVSRVAESFHVDLPVTTPLEAGATVKAMAELIARERARGAVRTEMPAGTDPAVSHAQERLWVLHQLDQMGSAYNVSMALRLRGALDIDALRASLTEICSRHDVLRSAFPARDGSPVLVVRPAERFELPALDFHAESDPHTHAVAYASQLARQPFDLEKGPLVRGAVCRVGPDDHLLALVFHHIASDAWSRRVLRHELATLYPAFVRGEPSTLPPIACQYPVLAGIERRRLASGALDSDEKYWRQQLEALPPQLQLRTDKPRDGEWSSSGGTASIEFGARHRAALLDLARANNVTLFMVLLAGFGELLHHHSGNDELIIGIPVAGRIDVRAADLIGPFVNTLPIRIDLRDRPTFRTLIGRVRRACLDAYDHQALPFERIVEIARPPRSLNRAPLAQVLFQLRAAPASGLELGGVTAEEVDVPTGGAKFDLSIDITDHGDHLTTRFEYPTTLFEAATVERIGRHFAALLLSVCARPDEPVSGGALVDELDRRLVARFATEGDPIDPAWTVPQRIAAVAAQYPSAPALQSRDELLNYSEMQERVDALARHVRAVGAPPGSAVGVCVPRGVHLPIAILAVLRAGTAAVPLDPSTPVERLAAIATEARVETILTTSALLDRIPRIDRIVCIDHDADAIERASGALPESDPAAVAYVIATSGSTGRPKAVAIRHGSFACFLAAFADRLALDDRVAFLASTSVSFDPALRELLLPLVLGGRVLIAEDTLADDPRGALDLISHHRPTLVQGTPTTLRVLLDAGWSPDHHVAALSCGEPLPAVLARRLSTAAEVWNLYGPTEATQCAVVQLVNALDGIIPVGRPLAGVVVDILDDRGEATPIGVPGEICLGGSGLAHGSLGSHDRRAFVSFERGDRYRTGDIGRWRDDGSLECLGRIDHQFKRHGVRIEPGEVQAALTSHAAVRDAVVAMSGARLVAWIEADGSVSEGEVLRHVRARLPRVMVPDAVIRLDALPTLASGKIDRSALREAAPALSPTTSPPTGMTERRLAALWGHALDVSATISRDVDFFALGGHSLLAIELSLAIERAFGRRLPFTQFFATPTIEGMAAAIESAPLLTSDERTGLSTALVSIRSGDPTLPLLLWVPGLGGTTLTLHRLLASLPSDVELMGFEAAQHRGLPPPTSFAEMAQWYADDVRGLARSGLIGAHRPYVLAGSSFGAVLALEIARRLFDDCAPGRVLLVDPDTKLRDQRSGRRPPSLARRIARRLRRVARSGLSNRTAQATTIQPVARATAQLRWGHQPLPYPGSVVLITSAGRRRRLGDDLLHMRPLVGGRVDAHPLPGDHRNLLVDERVSVVASIADAVLHDLDAEHRQANAEGGASSSARSNEDR